ncbi:MAG: tRNA pseudouridine(55) synthase TruB [Actinomycetota bacterium]|nr:tRNA pseudouridine(55) synthase TruB [Actinomycetota bacterium]PLS76342.1 MAG: tRNA pseudouridine(55) synthase TruB [Actinomycetota bacterium]
MTPPNAPTDGLVVVDKEPGWTSHDVVAKCRTVFGQRRVGHAGTLDPDATGVLLVGLGRVTRLLRFLTALPKTYAAEVVLGVATSTLDASGEVTGEWDMTQVSIEEVREAARRLVGPIMQVPPMVSALKVGGRRLYELARAGTEVEREARPVVVHRFDVEPAGEPNVVHIEVACSSGTYVRSLAADLGVALGGGAHLRGLRRTAVGSFGVADARPVAALDGGAVLSPAEAMRDYAAVSVTADVAAEVAHGKVLGGDRLGVAGEGPWPLLDAEGRLLAVYQRHGHARAKPAVVLASAT